MKKILIYGVAVAAIAGCSTKEETTEVKVFDASCEKVAVFEQGDMIVKCPINETLSSLQDQTPTGMFVQGEYEWATYKEYRIMVKNPVMDENSLYTVSVVVQE